METRYLTCAETAKFVRADLKKAWPDIRFSVRSETYSGGASINVGWVDGPTSKQVEQIAKWPYQGGGFDGSIDLAYSRSHWMLPDGSTIVADDEGTQGSGGVYEAEHRQLPHDDAQRVHFGADFIFCNRKYSARLLRFAAVYVARKFGVHVVRVLSGVYEDYVDPRDPHVHMRYDHLTNDLGTLIWQHVQDWTPADIPALMVDMRRYGPARAE